LGALSSSIKAVAIQVDKMLIVDNASSNYSPDWLEILDCQFMENISLLPQSENLGLGAPHNIGIKLAIQHGSKYVLILDQDSQVDINMVSRLRSSYEKLNEAGYKVTALGPQYRDSTDGSLSLFVKVGLLGFAQRDFAAGASEIEADFIISSGALIPVSALDEIGLMDESLFIDHVDTE
jgi:rhamnosyltransferase